MLNLPGLCWFFKITTLFFPWSPENGPKIHEYLGIQGFLSPDSLQKPFRLSFKFCGLSFKLAFVKQLRLKFKLGNLKDVSTTVNYLRMKLILKLQNVGYALAGIIIKILALIGSKNKQPCTWLIACGQKINFWGSIHPLYVRKSPMA